MMDSDDLTVATSYESARLSILASLQALTRDLEQRASKPFKFRMVSQMQAAEVERAYYRWHQAGAVGEPPGDAPSHRAAVYNQAAGARKLEAYLQVVRVAAVEAANAAIQGYERREIAVPFMMLRGLIERTANAAMLAEALKDLSPPPPNAESPNRPLIESGDKIARALYGTKVNWPTLSQVDFRSATKDEIAYVRKELTADMQAKSILTAIDKLNKRVPGARVAYDVLCEYLHPNVGDLYASTTRVYSRFDAHGTRHVVREIGLGPKDLSKAFDLDVILSKVLEICAEVIGLLPVVLSDLERISVVASGMARKYGHRVRKRYRGHFQSDDLCPCLSGLKVRDCK